MNCLKVCLCAAISLALVERTHAAANQLLNPGFETDAVANQPPAPFVTDWSGFGGFFTASTPLDPAHSGVGSLQLVGGGGFGVPGAFQMILPASPGQLWDLQGYLFTPNALPSGPTLGTLKIVFGDGTADLPPGQVNIGTADAPAFPGILSTPQLNDASTPGAWQFSQAQGIAPPGTVEVRLFALLVDENPATIYFDDLQALLGGDFDVNQIVNDADLPIWRGGFGTTSAGDANGDGQTDGNDVLIWQRGLNPGTMIASAAPEPATAALLAAGLTFLALRSKRGRP